MTSDLIVQPTRDDLGPIARTERTGSDVNVSGVRHRYAHDDVLRDVSLHVEHGELVTLLGPSGSGKSTLLRIIGGLERTQIGEVRVGQRDITHVPPEGREIGIVFQNYALFPHMSVIENVQFPLRMRRVDRKDARQRALEMLEIVELSQFERRRPSELSGGQQQRVALARALVFAPRVLLLDEPFGALDRRLREQLGLEVRRLQRELGVTTIFVTHDQDEAFTLSTRIAIMGNGEILQVDAPSAVYRDPKTLEVARFLGDLNQFRVDEVVGEGSSLHLRGPGGIHLVAEHNRDVRRDAATICGVRPEQIQLEKIATDTCRTPATVRAAIFGGDRLRIQLVLGDGTEILANPGRDRSDLADGDRVWLGASPDSVMLFDESSGSRIRSAPPR
jgi:ABC-type Fe3+/spermidine/putrescine transport system ATPase subunit